MHRLKQMKETLVSCILTQMGDLNNTDTKELGEAVDMVKDLAEAIYYCTITEAMEKNDKEETRGRDVYHYTERYLYPEYMRDMDKDYGRMYYSGQGNQGN